MSPHSPREGCLEKLGYGSTLRRLAHLCHYSLLGFLALGVLGGATPLESALPPPAPPRPLGEAVSPGRAAACPMEEPLRLLNLALKRYETVQDYSCLMIKRERIDGKIQPDNIISMKVRCQPLSIYLKWLEPRATLGQEACYVAGQNDGKVRVKGAGTLGLIGFVTLDLDDSRVRKASRHGINEAGIGNLLQRLAAGWEMERRLNRTQVQIAEYTYNKRRCVRVEATHPQDDGQMQFFRNVVYFDKESHLPIRVECYGWPLFGQGPGQLVEMYSYVNLQLNAGIPEETFQR